MSFINAITLSELIRKQENEKSECEEFKSPKIKEIESNSSQNA